jgi:DNA anti-recombination protein RmuC
METRQKASSAGNVDIARRTMIAERAYFRYQSRGARSDDPLSDWVEAEAEVDQILLSGRPDAADDHQRVSFHSRMENQLHEWDAVLDELRAKAQRKSTQVREEIGEQMVALETRRHDLQTRLDALRGQTGAAWHDLKAGAESAWEEMRQAVDRLTTKVLRRARDSGGGSDIP